MSEMAEIFQAMKAYKKEKQKAVGNEWAKFVATLDKRLLTWKSAYHCRIEHGTLRVDFWPTSGRFWLLSSPQSQHGLDNFRKLLALHGIHGGTSLADAGLAPAEVSTEPPILQPMRPDSEPGWDTSMRPF